MLRKLIKLANHLDQRGLRKEANHLDSIIRKMAISNSDETKERVVVEIDAQEAPDWGFDAAEKLLEALRKEAPDLDLLKLVDLHSIESSSFDEEHYWYEEDWEHSPEGLLHHRRVPGGPSGSRRLGPLLSSEEEEDEAWFRQQHRDLSAPGLLSSEEEEEEREINDWPGYFTAWTDNLLRSFNEGFEYNWVLGREVGDYESVPFHEKGKSVDFVLTPEKPWEVGVKVIHVRYTPGKLRIRTYEK